MAVEKSIFGTGSKGEEIALYTITNKKGMQAVISNLGGAIVKLLVPDKEGNLADVVLGYDTVEEYFVNPGCFGVVIGPNANRIGGAAFDIDGNTYHLAENDRGNNLHSDKDNGYQKWIWNTRKVTDNSVTFSLEDVDGNMGFPGNKKIDLTYSLDDENGLQLHYHGSSDKKTILNFTNHSYFNLDGHDSGVITEHELWIAASCFTPAVDAIPTGELASVAGTPMDFTVSKKVGKDIDADFEQIKAPGGYDHNWVIDGWDGTLKHFATLTAPKSGRVMKAYTTLPGVQIYVGNFQESRKGKGGAAHAGRCAICLETQFFPDSIHHENFPSCVFGGEGGKEYDSVTVYRFE